MIFDLPAPESQDSESLVNCIEARRSVGSIQRHRYL